MPFGESAALYSQTRRPYPEEVVDRVISLLDVPAAGPVLDLGCGTGIATRQLAARHIHVVGTDIDADMIEEARASGGAGEYLVLATNRLSSQFRKDEFRGATAFGAFHWFSDDVSVENIRHVLRPGAAFVVVNKNDEGDFRESIVEIVSRHVTLSDARPKAAYQPAKILDANGFRGVEETSVATIEYLSADEATAYVRSMRLWEEVPAEVHDVIEAEMSAHVARRLDRRGRFPRPVTATVASGRK